MQYLFVVIPNTRRATLFALRDAPCGHQETRRTAERTIRDFRVHISSQLETEPAGARNYSFFSPPTSLVHPHLQRRSALSELHNHRFRISALRRGKELWNGLAKCLVGLCLRITEIRRNFYAFTLGG